MTSPCCTIIKKCYALLACEAVISSGAFSTRPSIPPSTIRTCPAGRAWDQHQPQPPPPTRTCDVPRHHRARQHHNLLRDVAWLRDLAERRRRERAVHGVPAAERVRGHRRARPAGRDAVHAPARRDPHDLVLERRCKAIHKCCEPARVFRVVREHNGEESACPPLLLAA